jgi:hypothetical protein
MQTCDIPAAALFSEHENTLFRSGPDTVALSERPLREADENSGFWLLASCFAHEQNSSNITHNGLNHL